MGNMLKGSERQLVASMSLYRGEAQRRTGESSPTHELWQLLTVHFSGIFDVLYLFRNMYFINRFRRCFIVSAWNSLDLLEFWVKRQPFCNPLIKLYRWGHFLITTLFFLDRPYVALKAVFITSLLHQVTLDQRQTWRCARLTLTESVEQEEESERDNVVISREI